jgi:hypothetical protein
VEVEALVLLDVEEKTPVVGDDEDWEDSVAREDDEPEAPGASATYTTIPPITMMPTIAMTAISLAMPRFMAVPTGTANPRPYPTA